MNQHLFYATINTLGQWFKNNLILNVNKTQIINFTRGTFTYKDQNIISETSVTFLGVTLDRRLDWKEHILQLLGNISKFSYALRILLANVKQTTALTVYYAYVQYRISYGMIF